VVAVLAIGFCRVALGVHYVSDVWGGFVLGAAWLAAMAAAFNVPTLNRPRRAVVRSGRSPGGQPRGGTPGR
jgi:undecaprenyl-diphosphatase